MIGGLVAAANPVSGHQVSHFLQRGDDDVGQNRRLLSDGITAKDDLGSALDDFGHVRGTPQCASGDDQPVILQKYCPPVPDRFLDRLGEFLGARHDEGDTRDVAEEGGLGGDGQEW